MIYIATVGTTSTFANELIKEIREVCDEEDMWLHIDSAMSGFACCLEKHRNSIFKDIESAHSLTINFSKWPGGAMDSSLLWSSRKEEVFESLKVSDNPLNP